ncbi:hypothetical protein PTE_01786 [Photorhabdus khanii NC19]|uniref:Uncharacterized protein n=1 Tax=Photorhabdus khanii NC19 TaxID=1004151 RepID=W3VAI4_9GAMM|nr:hypothetical protein [Photorhabdus khanii]ETS32029.1 hypothetical protein PTE_01786 [Photorhabdus khanii NC19]
MTSTQSAIKTIDLKRTKEKQLAVLDEEIQARKNKKQETRENIRRTLHPYEGFITGAELKHRRHLKGVTQIEAVFFLAALIRFAGHPRLGGHHHHNCGLVETEWDVEKWNNAKMPDFTVY